MCGISIVWTVSCSFPFSSSDFPMLQGTVIMILPGRRADESMDHCFLNKSAVLGFGVSIFRHKAAINHCVTSLTPRPPF